MTPDENGILRVSQNSEKVTMLRKIFIEFGGLLYVTFYKL